ncbi:hypothetical protein Q7O_003440 [Pectobacterium carotovorum subsp. carotovorum PCCS1]|nr:hypothetical protein [Pectobacterium carotovorum subsp. carotovorum PCCS1]
MLVGLSPLARGTRASGGKPTGMGRFIPAGAGNTLLLATSIYRAAVYPRWRGEHALLKEIATLPTGLSPLARGTL